MKELFVAVIFMMLFSVSANAQEVKYIEAPKFENQIYLYGEPDKADVEFEQWYEIEKRGQFVRNVKVPALIPYLPSKENSNGAAIIIAPGGAFYITPSEAEVMRLQNGLRIRALQHSF